jgi:release factor glutamine methyltransferase
MDSMIYKNFEAGQIYGIFLQEIRHHYEECEARAILDMVFTHVLRVSKLDFLLQRRNEKLSEKEFKEIHEIIQKIKNGIPVQYAIGELMFLECRIMLNDAVLIPRPETEELCQIIISESRCPAPVILDIGTGSACIAIALKKHIPLARVTGTDVSADALRLAEINRELNNVEIDFIKMDLLGGDFSEFSKGSFDVIVSNPPYIPDNRKADTDDLVIQNEPHLALFVPAKDPLLFYKRILDTCSAIDKEDTLYYFEFFSDYASELEQLLQKSGFKEVKIYEDFLGKRRFVRAVRG